LLCSELPLNPFARLSLLQDRLAATHTVYLIDLRPVIGNPAAPPSASLLAFLADFSLQILNELKVEQCSVLGSFMYASVAMRMATVAPDRIRRLILLGTLGMQRLPRTFWLRASTGVYRLPGFPVLNRFRPFRSLLECIDYAFLGPLRMKELFWNPAGAPISLEDLYEQNKTPEQAMAAFALMWCIRHMHCDRFAVQAGGVTCPSLLIHGEEDLWVPLASVRELISRMPNAKLTTIPQARHAPEIDQPEITLGAIEEFLA
jgi:pimeloyl-ACP methyl ester carboxylesterase